jgi:T5orf172 domain
MQHRQVRDTSSPGERNHAALPLLRICFGMASFARCSACRFQPLQNRSSPRNFHFTMRALEYVYVVGNGHAVKIGKSTTPEARIASLHTASSSTLVTYYVGATNGESGAIERAARSLLRPFRLNSEWFSSTPEAAIGAVQEAARSLGVAIIRCDAIRIEAAPTAIHVDPGVMSGTPAITRRQRDAPVVHKPNLSVPRGLIGTMLLAFAAAVGVMIAFAIQFLIING